MSQEHHQDEQHFSFQENEGFMFTLTSCFYTYCKALDLKAKQKHVNFDMSWI